MHARDAWRSRWPSQAISRAELRILVLPTPRLPVTRHFCRELGIAERYVWMARAVYPSCRLGVWGRCSCKACRSGRPWCYLSQGCRESVIFCREYGIAIRYVWMAWAAPPQLPGGSSGMGVCNVGELAHVVDIGYVDSMGLVFGCGRIGSLS